MPTGNWGSTDLGGTVGTLNANVPLRVGWWAPAEARPDRGTIVLATGRAEFIEVYAETVADLLARGHHVIAFDFRGQGGSHRRAARGGHVDRFEDYVADLAAVVRFANQEGLPRPYHVLAHSMGGLVALLAAPTLEREVERMVLAAPLLELKALPAPAGLLSIAAGVGSVAGLSRRPINEPLAVPRQFAGNRLTTDPDRFEAVRLLVDANPELVTGPPTIGWVGAALRAMHAVRRRTGRALAIPTLFVASGQDAIVSTPAIDRFARQTPGAGLVIIPGARHQLLLERDGLRNLFFAAFDAYLAGAPRRLREARQPRFARTLSFTVGASGPPRLETPARAPVRAPAPAGETATAARIAAAATHAREATAAEAGPQKAAAPPAPPAAAEPPAAETPAPQAEPPARKAEPPRRPAPPVPSAEAPQPPAATATAEGVPAERGSDDADTTPRDLPRGHVPPHGGARAARIRERLVRRARRQSASQTETDLTDASRRSDGEQEPPPRGPEEGARDAALRDATPATPRPAADETPDDDPPPPGTEPAEDGETPPRADRAPLAKTSAARDGALTGGEPLGDTGPQNPAMADNEPPPGRRTSGLGRLLGRQR